jgi:hypothetical protein
MGRRVGAWLVAAAVTVALVVGGVLVARSGDRRAPATLPPLDLSGGQATGDAGAAAEPARAGGGAPGRPYDTGDTPTPLPQVEYRVRGSLPDLPDRAQAWRVGRDAGGGRVAALAAALGLRGQPKTEPSGWTVRDGDRVLRVNRVAGLPWSYGAAVAVGCPGGLSTRGGAECLSPDAPVSSPAQPPTSLPRPVRPVPPVKPVQPLKPLPRPADAPSEAEAERVARDLAARAGLPLDGASVKVVDAYAARLVTISPAVGGMPTHGFAWTVTVGPKGSVRFASGWLATPEPADTYPLIGVAEGVERLERQSPFGPPILRPDIVVEGAAGGSAPRRQVVTVTGVRLGLQLAPALPKGGRPVEEAFLLPAYLFQVEGGWTDVRSVVAIQDRYLSAPPEPPSATEPGKPRSSGG